MNEYVIKGPICNTIYRRYNKEYCTPPVYELYNFNWILCLCGILSSCAFASAPNEYSYVFWFVVPCALSYLINSFVIKNAFTIGFLNKSISNRSKMFVMSKILAYTSQLCFFQIIVPSILAVVGVVDIFVVDVPVIIAASSVIFVTNIAVPLGLFSKKHYNKNAQTAYSYIIEGPSRANESIEELYKQLNMEALRSLNHYEVATHKYHQLRNQVSSNGVELRKLIDHYETEWRHSIVYAQYMYCEIMPSQTPHANRLVKQMLVTNESIKNLNVIVDELNAIEYIPKPKKTLGRTKTIKNQSDTRVSSKPHQQSNTNNEPLVVDVIWNYEVNWY